MKKVLLVLTLAAVVLTGCGGGAVAESTSTPTATPTPTQTVEQTATAKQFASILAENETTWRAYAKDIVSCAYDKIVATNTAAKIHVLTCTMTAATVTMQAKTAQTNILKLPKPAPEVKDLVDRTIAALGPLSKTGADKACLGSDAATSSACDDAETLTNGAIRDVISVLDAWRPYMGS